MKLLVLKVNKKSGIKMIQKKPTQIPISFIPETKKLTELLVENQRLESELNRTKQDYKKLQVKYQKSLKQLALIVKANQTLKKDYDELQLKIDSIAQQKAQITRSKIKQYIKKEIDDLNNTIQLLNDQKDQLQINNNSLNIKVKTLLQEKTKILNEKENLQKKYSALEAQLQSIVPEVRGSTAKSKSVKELREKVRLVDQLQQAVHKLQEEKQQIQKDFEQKMQQIESLWHQWYQFQHELNESQSNEIKLHDENQQPLNVQRSPSKSPTKKKRRKGSIIYQHGMKILRGEDGPRKGQQKRVHFIQDLEQKDRELSQMRQNNRRLETENQKLKFQIQKMKQNDKIIEQLKMSCNKLKQEKLIVEQRLSELRIQSVSPQKTSIAKMSDKKDTQGISESSDEDLVSILKDLHGQLGPLRSELITMKKLQSQQTQITSAQKANTEVKLIRLEKELSFYKDHNEALKKQLLELKSQKELILEYQNKIAELQELKITLQGKLIVMQTLKIADRTRVEGQTYNTLEEFEKRMKILAKDSTILKDLQGNHLHQLVAMKAYILELDDKMKMTQLQNEKISKKYSYTKEKLAAMTTQIKEMESQQSGKVSLYKEKIQAYDKLVSKLTAELEKNIEKNSRMNEKDSRQKHRNHKLPNGTTSQEEIHKVITLYEQKMTNMGEQIVRIRKDRDDYEEEVKELRSKLNIKFKELNEKQRQIVVLKTQVINLQNVNKGLERQLVDRMERQSDGFAKSKIASTVYDHQRNDTGIFDESKEVKRVRDDYERHLMALNFKIEQLQEQVQLLKRQNEKQKSLLIVTQKDKQDTLKENEILSREQLLQEELTTLKNSYEQEQIASIELIIQKHAQLINELKHKHSFEQQQMIQTTQQLHNELKLKNENILKLEQLKTQFQQVLHEKDLEIHNLNQVIAKNNHEMQQLNNLIRFNNYFIQQQKVSGKKNLQQKKAQKFNESVTEDIHLQNQLYEKNVYITSLQSTIYNLKLENQRYKGDFEIFLQKLEKLEVELKIKHSTIFNLQNQIRKSSNLKDSAIIAKDSLIRSYENEIINLKHSIEDLKSINKFEQERNESLIRELNQKLRKFNADPQSSINQLQVNISTPQQSIRPQESLQSGQSSIEENRRFIYDLQAKIGALQSQLKYTQEQLLASSEEINRLNLKHELIPSSSSIASLSYEEKMQILESQMLTLRTTIFSLQNEIQQKEQLINELRQEIFNLKLQHLKSSDKNLSQRFKKQEEIETQMIDQSTSPRKSPIQMIADDPVMGKFEYYIQELRNENQDLQTKLSHQQLQINLLNSQIERLNQYISTFKVNSKNKNQHKIQQENHQVQPTQQSQNGQQISQAGNGKSQHVQNVIQELKGYYESELYDLRQTIEHYESQLLTKNLKISELTRFIAEKEFSPKNSTQNQPSSDTNYLLQEIEKQNQLIKQKQVQVSDIQTLLTKYQSEENRSQENLSLIVMLMAEVESLRNQLQMAQMSMKKQQSETIQSNRVRSVSAEQKEGEEQSQRVDYGLIKDLQCSHEHLVNYQKMLQHQQTGQQPIIDQDSNSEESSSSPVTQTLVNQKLQSKLQISEPESHQRTISIQHQQILPQYQTIDQMKLIDAISFPSESNGSVNQIQSNYSIKNPFKDYYRPAHSTYHPNSIGSDGHSKKLSQLSVPGQIVQLQGGQNEDKPKVHTNLATFGKISESHNVDSSYGSRGLQSNQNLPQKQNPKSSQYDFKFKNINMIESVESTPNGKQQQKQKQRDQNEEKAQGNNFSFGKQEKLKQDPPYPIESRYIFQKNNLSLGESSQPQSSSRNKQIYSSLYMQHFPLTSTNSPSMQTTNLQLSPSFNSRNNLPKSSSYISDHQSSRSGSQASTKNYLPTYNEGSSTYLSGNQNSAYGSSNVPQTKLSSTLDKTSSYQQYISKFF